jgi:hypothetical protein
MGRVAGSLRAVVSTRIKARTAPLSSLPDFLPTICINSILQLSSGDISLIIMSGSRSFRLP